MPRCTVLCQIEDWQDISVAECLLLQKTKKARLCFGCDACSRLCSKCRQKKVVCSELDLCRGCLEKALTAEKIITEEALKTTFSCQLCSRCLKRLTYRSNAFGLCLRCGAEEFAGITLAPQLLSNGHGVVVPEPDPQREISDKEDLADLIAGLNDIEQIIVTLHRCEGHEMSKIGGILGLSEQTISQLYIQSLEKIKTSLNQERTSS